ncbi:MAG: tRNA (5-methylaminomethyl-2-thiouridine)(34)-methyltransferase MnmD [Crocinitomicaceae bacterium]|nr:tRNA (5-methylaminomethyl-2-thiouridine)(34)-methyltransferase MnmD [Crocinitomicaceae bacterium]
MNRELKLTSDGSYTLYVPELDEHYHSIHGAVQESEHVFIKYGIQTLFKSNIRVLEVGLGTCLNALLTAIWSENIGTSVDYTGIEAFPLKDEINKSLNYGEKIEDKKANLYFHEIIKSNWEAKNRIHSKFVIQKTHSFVEEFEVRQKYDIVYFDAFGPNTQGELWQFDILKKMYELLDHNGVFVTYCAKGQLKRDLNHIGFKVESLPGPPGKREMTRAMKF